MLEILGLKFTYRNPLSGGLRDPISIKIAGRRFLFYSHLYFMGAYF